jgi:hypothetical protein
MLSIVVASGGGPAGELRGQSLRAVGKAGAGFRRGRGQCLGMSIYAGLQIRWAHASLAALCPTQVKQAVNGTHQRPAYREVRCARPTISPAAVGRAEIRSWRTTFRDFMRCVLWTGDGPQQLGAGRLPAHRSHPRPLCSGTATRGLKQPAAVPRVSQARTPRCASAETAFGWSTLAGWATALPPAWRSLLRFSAARYRRSGGCQ